jgi:hypothetical protein
MAASVTDAIIQGSCRPRCIRLYIRQGAYGECFLEQFSVVRRPFSVLVSRFSTSFLEQFDSVNASARTDDGKLKTE